MKTLLQFLFILLLFYNCQAQMVGTSAFLQGTRVELGIAPCGSFGTASSSLTPIPIGYHNNLIGNGLGFVADAGKNGWSTPGPGTIPNYCGDYFLPGSPVEGWALQIDTNNYRNANVCSFNDMPGAIINFYSSPRGKTAVWRSSGLVEGKIRVTATTFIPDTGMAIITKVELCNETALPVHNLYYLRHVDPDNDQPWSGGSFSTSNTIVSQGNLSGTALVTATSNLGCFLGIGSVDSRARVSFGGFALPNKSSDVYNAVTPFSGASGPPFYGDVAISLCFNIPVIEAYSCECINYAYVLNSADLYTSLSYTDPIINCGVTASPSSAVLTGKTYYDIDNDCSYLNSTDYVAPFQVIRKSDGTGLSMSDINGNYAFTYMDTGTLDIRVDSSMYFKTACPSVGYYTVTIDSTTDSINNLDFSDTMSTCILPTMNINSSVFVRCRDGAPNFLNINIVNPSFRIQYGLNLIVHLNDSTTIDSSFSFTYLGANDYLISIPDSIPPYDYFNLHIPLDIGCDNAGTLYTYAATLTGLNDCDTFNIVDSNRNFLLGSFDPNQKLVRIYNDFATSYEANNQIDSLSELEYIITFQNSGTAPAFDVHIHDLIDGLYLDPNSIVLTGSSHPCRFEVDHNKFDVYFNDINLPFGPDTDPTTHGYVTFRIKQKYGNIRGTTIYNKANIIFDVNPPINTDFAISTISRAANTCRIAYNETISPLVCMNDNNASITLTPTNLGTYTYAWSNGSTSSNNAGLSPGTYTLTISNNYDLGCSQVRSFTISNPVSVLSAFSINSNLSSCENYPSASIDYVRTSGVDPISFTWSNGSNTPTISNLSSGNYTVTVCNNLGCCETNSYLVTSIPAPIIILNSTSDTVCLGDMVTINASGADTYTWTFDNSNASSLTTTITANSTFKVIGENSNNCIDSNEIIIYAKDCNVGINDLNNQLLTIYPNPNDGIFTISSGEIITQIEIINTEGKIVYHLKEVNKKSLIVKLENVNSGLYLVKIYTPSNVINKKITVK